MGTMSNPYAREEVLQGKLWPGPPRLGRVGCRSLSFQVRCRRSLAILVDRCPLLTAYRDGPVVLAVAVAVQGSGSHTGKADQHHECLCDRCARGSCWERAEVEFCRNLPRRPHPLV